MPMYHFFTTYTHFYKTEAEYGRYYNYICILFYLHLNIVNYFDKKAYINKKLALNIM